MEKPQQEENEKPPTLKPLETRGDINELCQMITQRTSSLGYTQNPINELYFYGNTHPMPLAYNNIKAEKNEFGLSVIATLDIPKGVIMTHFPVHAIGWGEHIQIPPSQTKDDLFKDNIGRYAKTHSRYITLPIADTGDDKPIVEVPPGVIVIGNPNNTDDTLLLGHVIRDAIGSPFAEIHIEKILNWVTFKNKVAMYYMNGKTSRNCRYVLNPSHTILSVETTREIKEGEELRIMYGAEHWFHRVYDKEDTEDNGNYLFNLLAEDKEFQGWIAKLYQ